MLLPMLEKKICLDFILEKVVMHKMVKKILEPLSVNVLWKVEYIAVGSERTIKIVLKFKQAI